MRISYPSPIGRRPGTGHRFVSLGIPAFLLAASLVACKKPVAVAATPPAVEVLTLAPTEVPLSALLIGQIDSPQNVEVRARVEAFVDKMLFTEGVEVKQGDMLFELDKKPFLEKLAGAQGALAEAKAGLQKYHKDVDRLRPLVEKRAIPQQDLDNALASVDIGKANVLSAEARVQSAQLDLGYCEVRAPINGLIGAKQVSIGDLVGKGEPTLLATMSTLNPMWFYCNISEVDYLEAQAKTRITGRDIATLPLTLLLANGDEHPQKGKFVFIDRAVDAKTGTLRIRAAFPNPDKVLRPGMFARARIDLGTRKNTIQVPERALVELQGKSFVWVVNKDNQTQQRAVKTGEQIGSNIIIPEGLQAGERIVVEGLQKVREGSPVNPTAAATATSAATTQPIKE